MTERLPIGGFTARPDAGAGSGSGKYAGIPRIGQHITEDPFGRHGVLPPARLPGGPTARWESRYRWAVIASDLLAIVIAVLVVGGFVVPRDGATRFWPLTLTVVTVLVVTAAMALNRGWHSSVLGQGAEEFRRLGKGLATAVVFLALGALAVGGLSGNVRDMRPWVFVVVPAIAVFAVAQRYQLRRLLHRARKAGRCLLPVLVAGGNDTVLDLINRTRNAPHIGWRVDAACTTGPGKLGSDIEGVPVVGGLNDLARHVRRGSYRIVAVTADAYWTPSRLRQLAWDLEGSDAEMVVAPVLMEIAGPRVHVTGVLGMPMLRVAAPVFTGTRRMIKEVVDRVGAAFLLLLFSPLLAVLSAAIAVNSRGPVFYTQRRVGKDGRQFTIVKFRTMVRDAHAMRAALTSANEGAGLLFKMREDPRVTRVGAVLRRWSLDELPQLFNVVAGSMSLVGPRPPLPDESARYAPDVRRRLLVKPGVTGLWQVSGRSDLSWDEAVRLDLRYVEDWSLALDAEILWKTARAVFSGDGAY
jgi:exopolysaccharide biosynthesis polyprenyl glycosylphosphotransferase